MELVEIRDLDGPNPLLLAPAIKLLWRVTPDDLQLQALARLAAGLEPLGFSNDPDPAEAASGFAALGEMLLAGVAALHTRSGARPPDAVWRRPDARDQITLAYGWERRGFALAVARHLAAIVGGAPISDAVVAELRDLRGMPAAPDDYPLVVRDVDRHLPIIAITGTNGKTTTTRLAAHILRTTGRRVGWCTTAGVYIDGELVQEGDYTGPAGARRVLQEPGLDVAVLETARGGILLRGLGYEHNDVGVFTNVSPDHLGLHGIERLETLAQVKATVVRVTRPGGYAVLNADDPLVYGVAAGLAAFPLLISAVADNPRVQQHAAAGGRALFVRDGVIMHSQEGHEERVVPLAEVPMTFGGRAGHMVENALCAGAACLGLGLPIESVAAGLGSFHNSPEQNLGRLNVYTVDGVSVVVDYAHNEAGLERLLAFARGLVSRGGRVISVIGTAGDRPDVALRGMGRLAAHGSDRVIIKETRRYLRGRASAAEMTGHFVAGLAEVGSVPWEVAASELVALESALAAASRGDVIAFCAIEQATEVQARLAVIGQPVS